MFCKATGRAYNSMPRPRALTDAEQLEWEETPSVGFHFVLMGVLAYRPIE